MMPNNILSSRPISAPFLPPRTQTRFSSEQGKEDSHYGGVAIGDASQGVTYQLWTARADDSGNVLLSAPNTPEFVQLPGVGAAWVALAIDQNARLFIAYATKDGSASYYWYDSLIPGYTTSNLTGVIKRVFAALDDNRVAEINSSDILLSYERENELFFRQQRDRFGVEYDLAPAPGTLVQVGMNRVNRFQFAFQNSQGGAALPPAEFNASTPL